MAGIDESPVSENMNEKQDSASSVTPARLKPCNPAFVRLPHPANILSKHLYFMTELNPNPVTELMSHPSYIDS